MSKTKNTQQATASVTPGPYDVRYSGNGFRVTGKSGVTIAWLSTSAVFAPGGGHRISMDEARANADLVLRAFSENVLAELRRLRELLTVVSAVPDLEGKLGPMLAQAIANAARGR